MSDIFTLSFVFAVLQITLIDILLGADNAILIALACKNLSPHEQRKGIYYGSIAAIVLRFILIFIAIFLLKVPFVKLVGGLFLIKIAVELLVKKEAPKKINISAKKQLYEAIKIIVIADFVMSLDNVIGIASIAEAATTEHSYLLVMLGILISIPIIMGGSVIVLKILNRYPQISYFGALLLGWIAGEIIVTDVVIAPYYDAIINSFNIAWLNTKTAIYLAAACGAIFVLALAWLINNYNKK